MKSVWIAFLFCCFISQLCGQPIPSDSLYLGQTKPGTEPKAFPLEVTPGTFAAERIAISKDGSEIYYSEIKSYYPVVGAKVRYYKYEHNRWSNSVVLFDGFAAPGLSLNDDTLFVEGDFAMFYSVRTRSGWTAPRKFLCGIDSAHYLQVTAKGHYFASARSKSSVGLADWSRIQISGKDTIAASLGFPVNNVVDNLDFYMAKDESFMITCPTGPIGISYPTGKGTWSNSRSLSRTVNFGISGWGAYMSRDNMYLFYTTGTKPDYSDVHVYWVNIGTAIDSLKHTNLPPYIKNKPAPLTLAAGKPFTFTVPADAICDDDGTVTRYEALKLDGTPLPEWLKFDAATRTLSGTPPEAVQLRIRINGYDDKNAMAAFGLLLAIKEK